MKKKVLVYDNAIAYYNMLRRKVHTAFEFELYNGKKNSNGFEAVIFFLNDKIEVLTIDALYSPDKPFVLVAPNGLADIKREKNVYVINMLLPVNEILKMFSQLLAELQQDVFK